MGAFWEDEAGYPVDGALAVETPGDGGVLVEVIVLPEANLTGG